MAILFAVICVFIIGIPPIYLLVRQSVLKSQRHTLSEQENRRLGVAVRMLRSIWLAMVMSAVGLLKEMIPVSPIHRAFWDGFIVASYFFIVAMLMGNLIDTLRLRREERRRFSPPREGRI